MSAASLRPYDAVELTRELVRCDTTNPPGNEAPIIALLDARLRAAGFETVVVPYPVGPNRTQLVARLRGSGERPGLLFSGHVDVVPPGNVPWTVEPFGGEIRDGRLYGRGSCDMKGGVAALVVAAAALARSGQALRGDLVVAVTADEERNCLGADALIEGETELLSGLGAALVAEPTSLSLFIAEKGALWVEVTLLGKTAHGSMPHLGANAIAGMADFLTRWEREFRTDEPSHPLLGTPTLTVGVIQGGVKANVVPDRCTAELDMRTVPPQSHPEIFGRVRGVLDQVCAARPGLRYEARMLSDRPPVSCPADSELARALASAVTEVAGIDPSPKGVPYCTEACVWVPHLGVAAVICGPGDPGMAHQPDEHVSTEELENAARVYLRTAESLLL
ncbi:MAG: M20 family metallopeptidase [Armatimonadota bacterium]